ncbi:lysylphosphatidylglycerol synthase transmembrane domain-containing protein [Alistipes sp. ZOR0009]|uniref:lysylphosphatidylglycerol synthase transmembrane domain-containing protein n=1 Tax=Alistipes sp. ZOR0009 TaxID=1339253 RepID=UPI00064806A5|nr:lysylphosphatidylglycerol synthase transmembrane domain-containing protein [Alistipes sp. ZOR0009]
MAQTRVYRVLTAAAKIAISGGAVWFVLSKVDGRELIGAFRNVCWWMLILSAVLFVESKVVSAYRLQVYFRNVDVAITPSTNLRLYWLGMFYNLFLPGGIGGDGYKVWLLHRQAGYSVKRTAAAVLLDRVNGMLAIVLLALLLALFIPELGWYRYAAALLLPLSVLLYSYLVAKLFPSFYTSIRATTLLSFAVQLLQVLSVLLIIGAIGITSFYLELVLVFLISSAVAVLPFTIGGVGAREVVFLYGSTILGLDSSLSVAISFIFFTITAVVSLGGVYYSIAKISIK